MAQITHHQGEVVFGRFIVEQQLGQGAYGCVYRVFDRRKKFHLAMKVMDGSMMDEKDREQMQREVRLLQEIKHPNVVRGYQLLQNGTRYYFFMELIEGISLREFIRSAQNYQPKFLEDLVSQKKLGDALEREEKNPNLQSVHHKLIRQALQGKLPEEPLFKKVINGYSTVKVTNLVSIFEQVSVEQESLQQTPSINAAEELEMAAKMRLAMLQKSSMMNVEYAVAVKVIFAQLVDIFIMLHEKQIVHRDAKPENVMITPELVVKLIDFGGSRKLTPQSIASTLVGTYGYIAPEIADGKKIRQGYNEKVDIWSLGAMFFELLYGYCPFLHSSASNKYMMMVYKYGLYLPPGLFDTGFPTDSYQNLIESMFQVDPEKRVSAAGIKDLYLNHVKHDHRLNVILLGNYGVGKTTLLRRFACQKALTSRPVRNINVNGQSILLEFYDTDGMEQVGKSLTQNVFREKSICFFVYDPNDEEAEEQIQRWRNDLQRHSPDCWGCTLSNLFSNTQPPPEEDWPVHDNFMDMIGFRASDETDLDVILFKAVEQALAAKCYEAPPINPIDVSKTMINTSAKQGCCPTSK